MKALNTMKYISNTAKDMTRLLDQIKSAETFEEAKERASRMHGYLSCMTTFLNTMIDIENNDFTGDFGDVLDDWCAEMYQALATKADETKQDGDTIMKLLKKRDEYRA